MTSVGFVGLGNMGAALAGNLVASGHDLWTHDLAGPERSPDGAMFVSDLSALSAQVDVMVLSLPDGDASRSVVETIARAPRRTVGHIVDTSTVGLEAARSIAQFAAGAGFAYVDAPVSGGVAGAQARSLTVMYAGSPAACEAVMPVLEGLSDRRYRVGGEAGMGQALKLANNFLSATALAATSEAVAFGTSVGIDMATMLEVLNASSGRSAASEDKFVNHVLPGTFASGFANTLMAKDVQLYLDAIESARGPAVLGSATAGVWRRFAERHPAVDFTEIYTFTTEG